MLFFFMFLHVNWSCISFFIFYVTFRAFFCYIFIYGAEKSSKLPDFQDLILLWYLPFLFQRRKFSHKTKTESQKWSLKSFLLAAFLSKWNHLNKSSRTAFYFRLLLNWVQMLFFLSLSVNWCHISLSFTSLLL